MPLDPGDPYYRAELISPTIAAMEHPLCDAFGVSLGNFGSKGNLKHLSGYHRSRNWILHSPDSANGSRDYSIQLALDNGDHDDDIAAFDFTPGVWGSADNRAKMKVITRRVIDAMQARDPRVANLREFAGTLDGTHVVTYDQSRNAFKTPFDSSHLDHGHGSIYRTKTRADHSGIVAVMLGEDMAWTDQQVADVYYTLVSNGTAAHARLAAIKTQLDTLLGRPAFDPAAFTAQLVPALAPALAAALPDNVDAATVIAAFDDPHVQQVLVQAANTAEDS